MIFCSDLSFAKYQMKVVKKEFIHEIDEKQLLEDLKSCFSDPYVSPGNPIKYSTGTCLFDARGQRLLLLSSPRNYDHV